MDRSSLPRLALPVWPIQIAQPGDFCISGLQSPFKSHYAPTNFTRQERQKLARQYTGHGNLRAEGSDSVSVPGPIPSGDSYKTSLQRWTTVLINYDLLKSPPTQNLSFCQAKLNSYRILKEWWANSQFDSSITQQIQQWIHQAAQINLDMRIWPRLTHSRYNLLLFTLWHAEFCCEHPADADIFSERMMAAAEAACHRLATSSLGEGLSRTRHLEVMSPELQPVEEFAHPMTADIHPCSWLDSSDHTSSSPRYLWDRLQKRVVETSSLTSAEYVAISHTWGRWRKTPFSNVIVEGVPWLVPENTLFDVTSLPALMERVPFQERYVWFDLICIPQEMFHPHFGPLAKIEIANQATIFRSASRTCAWFNSIPSWHGLHYAVCWLSMVYAHCNDPSMELTSAVETAQESADMEKTTYLLSKSKKSAEKNGQNHDEYEPSPWFTSLWTLQEVCLRPGMLLCDREWNICTSDSGFAMPLDHIIALWVSVYEAIGRYQQIWPASVRELHTLLAQTGLAELPRMSPLTVLMLGNQRYCEDKRAEAIMSVLNVRDWFRGDDHPESLQQPVLGRYPLEFVQELRHKLGGQFFASSDLLCEEVNEIGTLLPFSDKSIGHRRAFSSGIQEAEDHPSVVTWKVLPDGSVQMPKAGIIAGYPNARNRKDFARVVLPVGLPDSPPNTSEEVDLDKFLGSFMKEKEKYAVSLICSGKARQEGVVIMEAEKNGGNNTRISTQTRLFRKIGVFFFNMNDDDHRSQRQGQPYLQPLEEAVQWIVI